MLNVKKLKTFVTKHFDDNYSKCADAIGVNKSTISRIINKKIEPGVKFMSLFSKYCKENSINLDEYFF